MHRFGALVDVAAGDVPGLMRQDADQLIWRVGMQQQARVDEDVLPAGDKRINAAVRHQIDVDGVGIEPGRLPDRRHHCVNVGFDLGVAQQADAITRPALVRHR